jgi:prepilin-type N-terminal cleavage/methylation domain-containing protein/prepilin-type processing-associated H-X9-DG protein
MKTRNNSENQGFTLTELLVVIVTLGVLTLVLAPALANTKPNSQAFQCLENQRRLALAWRMYAGDNNGLLPMNGDEASQPSSPNSKMFSQWCPGRQDLASQAADPAWIKAGSIYPYVKQVAVYRCPADSSTALVYGKVQPRTRSVSMNSWLAPYNIWNGSASGRVMRKESDFRLMGAANVWLLMDENPFGINDGYMAEYPPPGPTTAANLTWVDYPASYHNGAAGISFCDGHVILKKWADKDVLGLNSLSPPSLPPNPTNCPDLPWLQSVSTRGN